MEVLSMELNSLICDYDVCMQVKIHLRIVSDEISRYFHVDLRYTPFPR